MKRIFANKPVGLTPLEHLTQIREMLKIPNETKMCYAGRLDPMAHGLMVYLVGDECKKMNEYTGVDKTYVFEMVVGLSTDTTDVMGEIIDVDIQPVDPKMLKRVIDLIREYNKTYEQEYHIYSSKRVGGKLLWKHAADGTLDNVQIPKHTISIRKMNPVAVKAVTIGAIRDAIRQKTEKFPAGQQFRQDEIRDTWDDLFTSIDLKEKMLVVRVEARVSSGTYVRQIAKDISYELGLPILVTDIYRTSIGDKKI